MSESKTVFEQISSFLELFVEKEKVNDNDNPWKDCPLSRFYQPTFQEENNE